MNMTKKLKQTPDQTTAKWQREARQFTSAVDNDIKGNIIYEIESADLNQLIADVVEDVRRETKDDVAFLRCLEAAGVDNWDGYEVAQEMMG
jgi:uncharacterized UPF0160 family protein